jgi:hypothetical protein
MDEPFVTRLPICDAAFPFSEGKLLVYRPIQPPSTVRTVPVT